jgi:hypothetical protein
MGPPVPDPRVTEACPAPELPALIEDALQVSVSCRFVVVVALQVLNPRPCKLSPAEPKGVQLYALLAEPKPPLAV